MNRYESHLFFTYMKQLKLIASVIKEKGDKKKSKSVEDLMHNLRTKVSMNINDERSAQILVKVSNFLISFG